MNQSFGSGMPTGGTRGEIDAEARQLEHLRAFRELESERRAARRTGRAARRAERMATMAATIDSLRARIMGRDTDIAPDCCPA